MMISCQRILLGQLSLLHDPAHIQNLLKVFFNNDNIYFKHTVHTVLKLTTMPAYITLYITF